MINIGMITVIIMALIIFSNPQPSATFQVTPSSLYIQTYPNYVFDIVVSGDNYYSYTVATNTNIIITFPSQYPSLSMTTYSCSLTASPITLSSITCTMAYNTMTILGVFSSDYVIGPSAFDSFQIVVNSVGNPIYAQTLTTNFQGSIIYDTNQTLQFNTNNPIVIQPGILSKIYSI